MTSFFECKNDVIMMIHHSLLVYEVHIIFRLPTTESLIHVFFFIMFFFLMNPTNVYERRPSFYYYYYYINKSYDRNLFRGCFLFFLLLLLLWTFCNDSFDFKWFYYHYYRVTQIESSKISDWLGFRIFQIHHQSMIKMIHLINLLAYESRITTERQKNKEIPNFFFFSYVTRYDSSATINFFLSCSFLCARVLKCVVLIEWTPNFQFRNVKFDYIHKSRGD